MQWLEMVCTRECISGGDVYNFNEDDDDKEEDDADKDDANDNKVKDDKKRTREALNPEEAKKVKTKKPARVK